MWGSISPPPPPSPPSPPVHVDEILAVLSCIYTILSIFRRRICQRLRRCFMFAHRGSGVCLLRFFETAAAQRYNEQYNNACIFCYCADNNAGESNLYVCRYRDIPLSFSAPLDRPASDLCSPPSCIPTHLLVPLSPCSAGNRAYSFFEDQIVPHREALRLHKIKTNPLTGNFHSRCVYCTALKKKSKTRQQ